MKFESVSFSWLNCCIFSGFVDAGRLEMRSQLLFTSVQTCKNHCSKYDFECHLSNMNVCCILVQRANTRPDKWGNINQRRQGVANG